jgi:hypothetical protein
MFRSMANPFRTQPLSRARIGLALAVAVISDGAQMAAGPLGWAFFDQTVDVVAMILTSLILGFHPLLLPTFVVEFLPLVDMLPTWTGCVGAVILLRKRSQTATSVKPPVSPTEPNAAEPSGPVIDV